MVVISCGPLVGYCYFSEASGWLLGWLLLFPGVWGTMEVCMPRALMTPRKMALDLKIPWHTWCRAIRHGKLQHPQPLVLWTISCVKVAGPKF